MKLSREKRAMSLLREKNSLSYSRWTIKKYYKIMIKVFIVWECGSVIVTSLAHTRPWVQSPAKTNY